MSQPTALRRFDGKVALVTGASRGIGAACVDRLVAEGATVMCADINGDGAEETAARSRAAGVEAHGTQCDVGDEQAVIGLVRDTVERFGKLDVVVNMAGILSAAHTDQETLEQWERIMRVNLTGVFLVCREALPHLIESKGAIVNAASTSSLSGHPWFSAYGASKAGVYMMSNSMAMEYAKRGVRVNCVAPGGIDTDMTKLDMPEGVDYKILMGMMPIGPMGEPSMVADAVAFLASDDARFVNGEILRVDGATLA